MDRLIFHAPLLALALALASAPAFAQKAPKTTVVVGSFSTRAGAEYQWIGPALSEALAQRLLSSGEATLSQRQWVAVLRERDIGRQPAADEAEARAVGRELGADEVVVGSYTASWPDVSLLARRIRVGAPADETKVIAQAQVQGRLEELPALEQKLAAALFAKDYPAASRGAVAPKSVYAWRALSLCRDSLALQSLGPRTRVWLPKVLVEEALERCDEALKLDRTLVEAKSFRALAAFLLGRTAEAEEGARAALKARKEPGWPDLVAYWVLARLGKHADSDAALKAAIARRPGFLHARALLGEALAERGELTLARQVFEESLEAAPKQPWVLSQLGKVQARTGDVDLALKTTEQALALVPDNPVILLEKASREIDGKRWKEAEGTLRKIMSLDPTLAAAYLRLGYVYLETSQLPLAKPILEKAVVEADLQSEERVRQLAHFDLAKLFGRERNVKAALDHLRSAARAGFADRKRVEEDPDLAAVVKDPAYPAVWQAP